MRERGLRGPPGPGEPPLDQVILLRRYLCLACGAVIAVGPRGLLAGWLFSAPAMAWALWLFGVARRSAAEVRRRVSPWSMVGATAAAGWATLRRWARAVRRGRLFGQVRRCPDTWTLRQVASRVASTVTAFAAPADRELGAEDQVWRGALQLGRAIAM